MKKFLSLVLALVMTMSLVTVSAGAKDFTDASKITYDEAVAVMSAAKVIDGYAEGDFRPTNTLTRGAAAKIICNLILGPTTASALVADAAPYKDVPTTNTFAGYIAYCAKEGIISGYADGTFKPANTLTGYAFMKMLLGALGYDATTEGYTGNNWSIQVAKRALNIGLDDDLTGSFNGVKAVNREEACLYAFNTLKATMVEYENNNSVTVNGITFTNKSTAKDMVNNAKVETIKDDNKMQFAEKYFDKLSISTKAADKIDDFGRPATTWIYDKDTVGTYTDSADESIVLNKTMTVAAALITDGDYLDYNDKDVADDVTVYINGVKQSDKKSQLGYDLNAGDQVEVFENDDNEAETVAVIRYTLAKIDEVDTKLSSTHTKKGATASITLKTLGDSAVGGTYYDAYDGDSDKELPGFDADTYKADTVLAVAKKLNSDVILDSYVASEVEGKITAVNKGSKAKVTVSGTEYPIHAAFDLNGTIPAGASNLADLTLNDSKYVIYTDKNGYVIGIDETESAKISDVYYVAGIIKDTSRYNKYYAQAVSLTDGSVTEFELKTNDLNTNKAFANDDAEDTGYITDNAPYTNGYAEIQGLFTFEKDGSKYTAKRYITKTNSAMDWQTFDSTYTVKSSAPVALTDDLAKDDTKMTLASGGKFYLNDSTNYIKVEAEADDLDVKFITGGTSVKYDTVTPGTANVYAIAITKKDAKNDVASYVILVSADFKNSTSDDVVFVHEQSSAKTSYADVNGKTKTGYDTELYFLDGTGKIETVTVEGSAKAAGFYTYEINDDKVYELTPCNSTTLDKALSLSANYKDETGAIGFVKGTGDDAGKVLSTAGVALNGVYNNALTVNNAVSGHAANDVDFADNVIIRDNRGSAARDASVYTSKIESVSALKTAVDRSNDKGHPVKAVVFYDDEEVIMVYVMYVAPATNNNGGNSDQNATYTVSAAKKANTTTGEIELTVTSTDATDTTRYTAKVFAFSIGAGKDTAVEIGSVSSTPLVAGTSTVSVANNTNNSLVYYVEVTIDGDTLTTGTIIGG